MLLPRLHTSCCINCIYTTISVADSTVCGASFPTCTSNGWQLLFTGSTAQAQCLTDCFADSTTITSALSLNVCMSADLIRYMDRSSSNSGGSSAGSQSAGGSCIVGSTTAPAAYGIQFMPQPQSTPTPIPPVSQGTPRRLLCCRQMLRIAWCSCSSGVEQVQSRQCLLYCVVLTCAANTSEP